MHSTSIHTPPTDLLYHASLFLDFDGTLVEIAERPDAVRVDARLSAVMIRAAGGDKGTAIRALLREPEMAGTRPVFMGDDHTDEPGFVAAAELGGAGVLIGERRETAALYRLEGVEATLAWLEAASAEAA